MVLCSLAAFFTLFLNFDVFKEDHRWDNMKDLKAYAEYLIADPIVVKTKSPDYSNEFDKFFNYFGSAFRLTA